MRGVRGGRRLEPALKAAPLVQPTSYRWHRRLQLRGLLANLYYGAG